MTRPHPTAITLYRAARLVALIDLDDMGLLQGHTRQEITDAVGGVHRSSVLKDMRLLPQVRRLR